MKISANKQKINISIIGAFGRMGSIVSDILMQSPLKGKNINIFALTPVDVVYEKNNIESGNNFNIIHKLSDLKNIDVIIDFSLAESVYDNIKYAKENKIPIVECVTGLDSKTINFIKDASIDIPIMLASNTSIGITLLQKALSMITKSIDSKKWYVDIIEHHHALKKDIPSGTAKTLANSISSDFVSNKTTDERNYGSIQTHSIRSGQDFCEHEVIIASDNEIIKLNHRVGSRKVFAQGAIEAAFWLMDKKIPGLYSTTDMLESISNQ